MLFAAAIVLPPLWLLFALGALLGLLLWLRLRRPVVTVEARNRNRALRRDEVHRVTFPPAERWRGEARGFGDSIGAPLWA